MDISFVEFGSKKISFSVSYSARKTLGISINPAMEVVVKAPLEASIEKIKEKILKRATWIIKQQNFFLAFHPKLTERKYVSGETHLYLGRQYQLKVVEGKKNVVHYKGRFIEVETNNKLNTKTLLNNWYKAKAKEKFAEIAEPIIQKFKKYNVEPTGIYIQQMPTRWGSCTPKGRIILNPELIKAPKACIEYVITHELCHLVHHNHTSQFLELQYKEMPDWAKWKSKLEKLLA